MKNRYWIGTNTARPGVAIVFGAKTVEQVRDWVNNNRSLLTFTIEPKSYRAETVAIRDAQARGFSVQCVRIRAPRPIDYPPGPDAMDSDISDHPFSGRGVSAGEY